MVKICGQNSMRFSKYLFFCCDYLWVLLLLTYSNVLIISSIFLSLSSSFSLSFSLSLINTFGYVNNNTPSLW